MSYNDWSWSKKRKLMTKCVIETYEKSGYSLSKVPGRGLSNTWAVTKNGNTQKLSIRTTQDKWFAFPKSGDGWKTLDDVDLVAVASVDKVDNSSEIWVYMFNAKEVRERMNKSRNARLEAGMVVREDYGMWIGLDKFSAQDFPQGVGSGLAEIYEPCVYAIPKDIESDNAEKKKIIEKESQKVDIPVSVESIIDNAKGNISSLIGIPKDKIILEVRINV